MFHINFIVKYGFLRLKNYFGLLNIDLEVNHLIAISFTANAFLHHMIRNIIGTLIDVGIGKISPNDFEKILHQRDRSAASKTASA